jgi:hypothetical protein
MISCVICRLRGELTDPFGPPDSQNNRWAQVSFIHQQNALPSYHIPHFVPHLPLVYQVALLGSHSLILQLLEKGNVSILSSWLDSLKAYVCASMSPTHYSSGALSLPSLLRSADVEELTAKNLKDKQKSKEKHWSMLWSRCCLFPLRRALVSSRPWLRIAGLCRA